MSFRSKKLLRSAEGQACVLCASIVSTVSCHIRGVEWGSGTGIKAPDYFTAHLCQRCHDAMDDRRGNVPAFERKEMWIRAYMRTVARWFDQGIVVVK